MTMTNDNEGNRPSTNPEALGPIQCSQLKHAFFASIYDQSLPASFCLRQRSLSAIKDMSFVMASHDNFNIRLN